MTTPLNQILEVLDALCTKVGTPRALTVLLLARHGEWIQLQQLKCSPVDYTDAEAYFKDVCVTDFLRKAILPSGIDKAAKAVETFWACETQNAATNLRLHPFLTNTVNDSCEESVMQFIIAWRKEVRTLLRGLIPSTLTPRFSNGATYSDTGTMTTIPDKMSNRVTVYSQTTWLLPFWENTAWQRAAIAANAYDYGPLTVRGNIFFTVPKTGLTDRGCAKEASINVALQLDVAQSLRKALLRAGIDLEIGKFVHMALARAASVDGLSTTIDLSNASDTLCATLVKLILPDEWFELLDSLRARFTRVSGRWVRLEKFSSMGNGFTFELETLIFASLGRVIAKQRSLPMNLIKVFGDDIIVPAVMHDDLVAALRYFGFTPNERKTFREGPFRESCGGDYFDGVRVRPHYVEELPDEPQKWISLANGIRRMAFADVANSPRWDYLLPAWHRALRFIPGSVRRCRGPSSLGDIVIHDDPVTYSPVSRDGVGPWVLSYQRIGIPLPWSHWKPAVQLASCTLGLPSSGVLPRKGAERYRFRYVYIGPGSSWVPTGFKTQRCPSLETHVRIKALMSIV